MSVNDFVTQTYPIECKGRNDVGEEVLNNAINVEVNIGKRPGSSTISSYVECEYNTGGHGQRCKASHSEKDKVGEGVVCPYSFDIPYALENK